MNCIVTYQKSDGEIFIRPYNHFYSKKKGNKTSMGWEIIDIHYKHNNNYYCYSDFVKILDKELRQKNNKKLLKFIIKQLNKLA